MAANELLLGAIAMGFFVAGLLFLRYWHSTRDRFFLFFMLSFWVEAANRVHIAINQAWSEGSPTYYLVRLLAFALILIAIWDKNRRP
ncbi:MAG TPA: DUF5985 family protein [Burkholderiaceae bacterium]|nr:DUF5985 family protein [Burkholderiaceae bacterium]